MKVIIYAVGVKARKIHKELVNQGIEVLAFTDSNSQMWNGELFGCPIVSPDSLSSYTYDKIIIMTISYTEVVQNLVNIYGISREKIDTSYVDSSDPIKTRNLFLSYFSKIVYDKSIPGNVAEGGVFMGEFAKKINLSFPDRKLYLFDTFEGFDKRDLDLENAHAFSDMNEGHHKSSEEKVKGVLPHPENVIIRKGYFPETAAGIDDQFCFVNLDFDLYAPILAGLEFFYPKMVKGGVILVHDFFLAEYAGVKAAVDEFCAKEGISYMPISDEYSIAIQKP